MKIEVEIPDEIYHDVLKVIEVRPNEVVPFFESCLVAGITIARRSGSRERTAWNFMTIADGGTTLFWRDERGQSA